MSTEIHSPENIPIFGTMLIEASAGTGKTYVLERMVSRLIGRENNPLSIESILVVTFTNRAAREMKDRIRRILTQFAGESQRSFSERSRYRKALTNFDKASILTIHSFCFMVLGTWPFESSAPFQQEIAPGDTMEREEIHNWLASPETTSVAPEILKTVYQEAGSSKKLITAIVHRLTGDNNLPGTILLPGDAEIDDFRSSLNDSHDPEGQMSNAIDRLFRPRWSSVALKAIFKAAGGTSKTSASLEKILLHMAACHAFKGISSFTDGIFGDPAGVDIRNHFNQLLYAANTAEIDIESLNDESATLLQALKNFLVVINPYCEFRDNGRSIEVVNLVNRYMHCLFYDRVQQDLKHRIDKRKAETGIWGYADLIDRVSQAIEASPSPLKDLIRTRYKSVLIDEFQDTDPRQWQIFRTLFDVPGHILSLIGDPKQSIYGFRGTGLQSYHAAKALIPEKNRYHLDTNYRSRAPLVKAVNHFFAPMFRTRSDDGEALGFSPVKSGRPVGEKLRWPHSEKPIAIIKTAHETDYADGIVREIRALLDPETGAHWVCEMNPNGTETRKIAASDIAVLVRSARQEETLVAKLSALEIPTLRYRSRSVFRQPLYPAVEGLLQAFDNPRNQALWRTVLLDEFFRLSPNLLVQFEENGYLDHFSEKGQEWKRVFSSGRSFQAFESFFDYGTILATWAEETGYTEQGRHLRHPWTRRVISQPGGERHWQDWRQICELIQKRQFEGQKDIPGIIAWMHSSAQDSGIETDEFSVRLESESPAVRVLTMHAAKGMEFPLVFLCGGFTGKSRRSRQGSYRFDEGGKLVIDRLCREKNFNRHRAHNWEEDKRLWYVAFTRAIYKLWVPCLTDETCISQIDSFWNLALSPASATSFHGFLPPHESFDSKTSGAFRRKQLSEIDQFVKNSELCHIVDPGSSESIPLPKTKNIQPPPPRLAMLPSPPAGSRDPSTASYTTLLRQQHQDGHMNFDISSWGEIDDTLLGQDKGAMFGILIHAYLEQCDFSLAGDSNEQRWFTHQETENLFASLARRYYSANWYEGRKQALKTMVRRALRVSIPNLGRLCDLVLHQYRREIEFQMYIPKGSRMDVGHTAISINNGYLKGVIDLLLCKDGQWWVVDWKTNLLQPGQDYETIMDQHLYQLQYELYLLGLCRTLSGNLCRPIVWEKEIGGAVYLFLRTLEEKSSNGILISKPDRLHMLGIAEALGCSGVIE